MIINEIVFTCPAYVQWLKQTTYNRVAILAIHKGTLDGCWETLIGEQLRADCTQQNSAAIATMSDLGFDQFTPDVWDQAGALILNNNKIELDVN